MVSRATGWLPAALLVLAGAGAAAHEGEHRAEPSGARHGEHLAAPARAELGASAAFAADGTLWVASKEAGHVVVRRSADRGRHWSPPRRVNAVAEPVAADGDARPKIATGPAGEVYVSWTRPLSRPYTGEVRFARAVTGEQFDPPQTVHRDRQEITHRFDALAVGSGGQVFVAWIDKRDQELAKKAGQPYRGAAIYFAVSDNRGASFAAERKVADASCECCRLALAAQPDGSVLALWRHVFAPNLRDHALARLRADGSSEAARRATFDDWRVDACPHHGPGLASTGDGRLHAVWYTGGAAAGVYYGRLAEASVEGQRRLGGAAAAHADIATQGQRIAVAWKEFDGRATRLRAELSADGGLTWTPRELAATAGASDQPRLLGRDGRFLILWNTAETPLGVHELD